MPCGRRVRFDGLAQCAVAGFYRKAGFREQGRPYTEAGIEHLKMVKTLASDNNEKTDQ
jgi:predicted GNAT family N-acyltransferase